MEIRKLEYVHVREIWKDEAKNFTQWLANNSDYLSDKLGFNLNVIETERQIGSFNVDIFAEDDQGNSVIIENQLEKTDHTHLGQLLTYAVGAAAKTIIWISPQPREEHVEVIEWLNEITPVDMKWYLFKIETLKVTDSVVSPLFTKVVGPSQEIKALGSEKKDMAERHYKRIEFWEMLLPVLNQKTNVYKNVNPVKDNWLNASAGVGGIYYQIVIRMENASILVVVDKSGNSEFNKKVFDYLYGQKEKIESQFGSPITWRRMNEQVSSRIQYDIPSCGLGDKSTWKTGQEDIANRFVDFEKAFSPFIKQVKSQSFE